MDSVELRKIIQHDLVSCEQSSDLSENLVAIAQRIADRHGLIGMTNIVRMVVEEKALQNIDNFSAHTQQPSSLAQ